MITYVLKGNISLVIFRKYLDYLNISLHQFFKEINEQLIESNFLIFHSKIINKEINIPKNSKLELFYKKLKRRLAQKELTEQEYEQLSKEDLEEIMKKLK